MAFAARAKDAVGSGDLDFDGDRRRQLFGRRLVAGRESLSLAMHCPDAIGNPFLHLRLGQCQYELGNLDQAADELARAYMGGGEEIFEEDEREYFTFLKTRLKPPPGGR
jgi:hypothetical protein